MELYTSKEFWVVKDEIINLQINSIVFLKTITIKNIPSLPSPEHYGIIGNLHITVLIIRLPNNLHTHHTDSPTMSALIESFVC